MKVIVKNSGPRINIHVQTKDVVILENSEVVVEDDIADFLKSVYPWLNTEVEVVEEPKEEVKEEIKEEIVEAPKKKPSKKSK